MFLDDEPIRSSAEDILCRKKFADSLAQALVSRPDKSPLVIGLLGPWGSGKSSILRMARECLAEKIRGIRKEEQPIVIEFNPWMVTDETVLIYRFFDEMLGVLGKWNTSLGIRKTSRLLETYSDYLTPMGLIPTPEGKIIGGLLKLANWFNKWLAGFVTGAESIEKQKRNIDEALAKQPHKLIIIIDEIDRLSATEARQLFQVVKSLANFPNTVYLLAFDEKMVAEQLAGVQIQSGEAFLEKIVQVPFRVPEIPVVEVHRFLQRSIRELMDRVKTEEYDQNHLRNVFQYGVKPYIADLREAKRYLNVLSFNFNTARGGLSPTDLIGITVLQLFEPAIYEALAANKTFLTRQTSKEESSPYYIIMQNAVATLNEIVKSQKGKSDNHPLTILQLLFPKINKIVTEQKQGGVLDYTPQPQWRREGRILLSHQF